MRNKENVRQFALLRWEVSVIYVSVIYVKMIFIKINIPQYYLLSLFYFYIGSFLLNIIYIKKLFWKIIYKNVTNFFLGGVGGTEGGELNEIYFWNFISPKQF